MNQHGISVTPQNYAVWYEYVAGANLPLKEAIDTHIIEQGSIDDARTKELYSYFLESGKEQHDLIML
jgi:diguanylate cyclase